MNNIKTKKKKKNLISINIGTLKYTLEIVK